MTTTDNDTIVLNQNLEAFVMELADARAAKKAATDRETAARTVLVEALHEQAASVGMTASGGGVKIQIQSRKSVNAKKLEALYPEVYAEVTDTKDIEVLKLI